MSITDTRHKRKSLIITILLMSLVVFLLFYTGLKYLDPPPESGIDVVFGVTSVGQGQRTPPPKQEVTQHQEQPSEPTPPTQTTPTPVKEEVLTQENQEEVVLPKEVKKEEKTDKKVEPNKDTKPQKVTENQKPKEKPQQSPKPSKETTDALSNIFGAADAKGEATSGQGDDKQSGYKGDPQGNPYANSFYGSGGSGSSGKGWGLNGRSLKDSGLVKQNCNESGRVVVQIEVNQSGNVIKITPGVRGTTNNHPCLMEAAKETAKTYRWNADKNAPISQVGFIVINFKLGE
ncbi:cell envelope integrity protein TolA [Capnocytophaga canimorsus]|uniref:cell envelope integrity protein TolA n=1 Tax=Capnocytophaga canimorsus TaxID=28188 RepID=UPI0037CDF296